MIALVVCIFICVLFLGFPIFMSIALSTFVPVMVSDIATAPQILRATVSGVNSTVSLAIPLFMLSGVIMSRGKISEKLFDVFTLLVGRIPGGLPIAVVLTGVFYGAICGSGVAATAAIGAMAVPTLLAIGYEKNFVAALIASAGCIGVIIPPSIPMMTFALVTNCSVGNLFTAGFIPGVICAVAMIIYIELYCRTSGENKELIKKKYNELRSRGVYNVLKDSFWALLSPVIVLGGIYAGIVTPTEAAVISVFYSLFVCLLIYRSIKIKDILAIIRESIQSFAPLGLLLGFAIAFGRVLSLLQVPDTLANFLVTTFNGKGLFLLMLVIFLLIIGMFMDVGPAIIIFAPILLPVMQLMGVDVIQFGIISVVALAIGLFTPPYGLNIFVAAPLCNTSVADLAKYAFKFAITFILALLIITYVPWVSLALL